jgi:small subunit ribosomal protein S9
MSTDPVVSADEDVTASQPEMPSSALPEMPSSQLPELKIGGGDAAATVDATYQPVIRGKIDRFGVAMGTGRRKTSVARVRIKEGTGSFVVNGRPLEQYLCVERDRDSVMFPLRVADKVGKVDISIRVQGGGTTGQTGAMILGIRPCSGRNEPGMASRPRGRWAVDA